LHSAHLNLNHSTPVEVAYGCESQRAWVTTAGAGLRFSGRLDGFFYGSLREMAGVRYWGIGIGAIL